jgi:hypothetical protein
METFRIGLRHGWFGERLGGRNTLVRVSDRVEAAMAAFVVLIGMLTIPVAAAFGTACYDLRSQETANHAALIHSVTATVTGPERVVNASPTTVVYSAPITWHSSGGSHIARFRSTDELRRGDLVSVWVDDSGVLAAPPEPAAQVVVEAIAIAALLWTLVMGICCAISWAVRRALDRGRLAQWDQELRSLLT